MNADGFVSTGQGLLGSNMFAYCLNNPVNLSDYNGDLAGWVIAAIVIGVIAIIGVDHTLAHYEPDGVAVYDDQGKDRLHDQFLYAKGSGAHAENGEVTLMDFEAGIYKGTSQTECGDISLATFGTVEASAKADFTGFPSAEASAVASAYTMSYDNTFTLFNHKINISAKLHTLGIGGGGEFDFNELKFAITTPFIGIGGGFEIDID